MKALVIYNNPRILAQSLFALKELWVKDFDIVINKKYPNNKKQLDSSKERLQTHTKYNILSQDEIKNNYEYIIRPTPIKNDGLSFLYKKFSSSKFIFIEEGMSFYSEFDKNSLEDTEKIIFLKSDVFLSHPERVGFWKKIEISFVNNQLKERFLKEIEMLPKEISSVVFTEPNCHDNHDKQYKKRIENLLNSIDAPILLKKHPRDDTKYITESTLFECENAFSWQLLFNIFPKAKFIFTSPSTLELYTTKDLDVERFY